MMYANAFIGAFHHHHSDSTVILSGTERSGVQSKDLPPQRFSPERRSLEARERFFTSFRMTGGSNNAGGWMVAL